MAGLLVAIRSWVIAMCRFSCWENAVRLFATRADANREREAVLVGPLFEFARPPVGSIHVLSFKMQLALSRIGIAGDTGVDKVLSGGMFLHGVIVAFPSVSWDRVNSCYRYRKGGLVWLNI